MECIISVRDSLQTSDESRACTLVNMASDTSLFVEKAEADQEIQIDQNPKMTMFCEIRQTDATEQDRRAYGSSHAIDTHVMEVIKSPEKDQQVVLHKTWKNQAM